MNLTGLSVLLLLAALLGWWRVDAARAGAAHTRSRWGMRALLVAVALAVHLNLFAWAPRGGLVVRLPAAHVHDSFHYYLGTRYFAELGYTGLYTATLRADYEHDPASLSPRAPLRDLATNRLISQREALDEATSLRARFAPERWEAFERDVAYYRERSTPEGWRDARLDHGYNGTPLVTALLGAVASQPWLEAGRFLAVVAFADLASIALLAGWLAWREGAALALGFLFFTFANPLNDFSFIGGSYLRYLWFVALAGALFALRRERLATSGALLAVAGWLRIFPLAVYGFLLLRDLAGPGWRARLRQGVRLHAAFALASLAILGATSLVATPSDRNPWLAFADKIRTHAGTPGTNQVSLAALLSYSPELDRLHEGGAGAFSPSWSERARAVREERAAWVWSAAAGLLALALASLRHAPRTAVLVPALLAIFCVMPMTSYYWSALSLLALVPATSAAARAAPLVLFGALALASWSGVLAGRFDLRYALQSAEVLGFLTAATAWLWWTRGEAVLATTRRSPSP